MREIEGKFEVMKTAENPSLTVFVYKAICKLEALFPHNRKSRKRNYFRLVSTNNYSFIIGANEELKNVWNQSDTKMKKR